MKGIIITQQDRCKYLNDVGGCMIGQSCNEITKEARENRLCYIELPIPKRKRKVKK